MTLRATELGKRLVYELLMLKVQMHFPHCSMGTCKSVKIDRKNLAKTTRKICLWQAWDVKMYSLPLGLQYDLHLLYGDMFIGRVNLELYPLL